MIPLNNTVKIHKADTQDVWGIGIPNRVLEYRVRLDFNGQSYLVQTPDGKGVMFQAQIFFKGAVDIDYDDYIEYDSVIHGIVKDTPKKISPMIDVSGKVLYTQVKV